MLNTAGVWFYFENKVILYSDDTTFYAELALFTDCTNIANSLNKSLFKT